LGGAILSEVADLVDSSLDVTTQQHLVEREDNALRKVNWKALGSILFFHISPQKYLRTVHLQDPWGYFLPCNCIPSECNSTYGIPGLFGPKKCRTSPCRNVGMYLPNDTATLNRRPAFSAFHNLFDA